MFKLIVVVLALALAQVLATPTPIPQSLKHTLRIKGTANIIVSMKERTFPVLNQFKAQTFVTRAARVNQVAGSLKNLAAKTQGQVLAFLSNKPNIKVKSLWVNNKIIIKGADFELIQALAGMEEVGAITEDGHIPLPRVNPKKVSVQQEEIQWGVRRVGAVEAWAEGYNGNGVVVATIDTGALYTHKDLVQNFRQSHGWFDPYYSSEFPEDNVGHGTHVVGTIAGANGIGVAPGAQWIACKGCDTDGCEFSTLLECGQFVVCPTLPDGTGEDCSLAPVLVSNSWGSEVGGSDFYDEVIATWSAAGIIPVFSNGNSGSRGCSSAGSPADSLHTPVIAVGATDVNEELAYFSSLGPSTFDASIVKPDIAAPGVDIISADGSRDDGYTSKSGTSMACPHVAGAIALLFTNGTELTYAEVSQVLYDGAARTVKETGANCGGIPESEYPNNHVGHGLLNIAASINKFRQLLVRE